jgi:glutamine amidotransferase
VKVAVLDLGMGNLHSVAKALAAGGAEVSIASRPTDVARCDGLCVPGQGVFSRCTERLAASGAAETVRDWITGQRPYLGICLGMQVLFESSDETGPPPRPGLGVVRGHVTRLPATVTVPHIGWNTVEGAGAAGGHYYFDHSFACHPADDSIVYGWCEHGHRFAAWIRQGSATAVQFHPEKSGRAGVDLLRRWVAA